MANGDHRRPPLQPARRAHILAELDRVGTIRVSQLIDDLGVTPVTVRRDLAQLEEEGVLVRVHGGAVRHEGSIVNRSAVARGKHGEPPPLDPSAPAIAVLVPSLTYYWPTVARGMEQAAHQAGYRILLRGASYELQDERPLIKRLVQSEGVRGLIVAPNTSTPYAQDVIQRLSDCGVPSVLVERDGSVLPDRTPFESVTSDHAFGTLLAARHFAALGHKNVGLVLQRDSPTARKIAAGWQAACRELGLTPTQHFEQLVAGPSDPDYSESVSGALDRAIATGTTAILAHPDPDAMALVDLAMSRGISVPGDLSVIAYDDEVANLFSPALTAVSPKREAVGAAAVDLLLKRIADPARPIHRISLSPSLVLRESTSAPRGA
ncbi:MAG TPA: substrate-binding domain-containing protein [Candidatus Lumbricidophila sp.]|nr:substrate-binding domain-containing protein [Candidatus Lumbricidophila sp.]